MKREIERRARCAGSHARAFSFGFPLYVADIYNEARRVHFGAFLTHRLAPLSVLLMNKFLLGLFSSLYKRGSGIKRGR